MYRHLTNNIHQMSVCLKTNNSRDKIDRVTTSVLFSLTFPDVSVCAHASVSLHLAGMSSEPEVFSVHINGQVLQQNGHKVSSVGLISGSTATARVVAVHPGRWLLSSHTSKHVEGKVCSFALAALRG